MNTQPTTHGKVQYWALGIIGAIITGTVTTWLHCTNVRLIAHGERIAVIESQVKEINHKLDRILEQKGK
jgi:hypothetical protein